MSDGYFGTFGHAWTPTEPGTYQIVASFNGDDSYGSSAAATFVSVGAAPSTSGQIEQEEPTHPLISTELSILIAAIVIAAIAIIAYWTIKRK